MLKKTCPRGLALLVAAPLLAGGRPEPKVEVKDIPALLLPEPAPEAKEAGPAARAASQLMSCALREAFHGQVGRGVSRANYVTNQDLFGYLMLVPGHGATEETGPSFTLKSSRDQFASTLTLRAGGLDRYVLRAGEQIRLEASEACSGQVFTMVDGDGATGEIQVDFRDPEATPVNHIILEPVEEL
jgi:hypothetical protein